MPAVTFCGRNASGVTCQKTFRCGARSTTSSGNGSAMATGTSSIMLSSSSCARRWAGRRARAPASSTANRSNRPKRGARYLVVDTQGLVLNDRRPPGEHSGSRWRSACACWLAQSLSLARSDLGRWCLQRPRPGCALRQQAMLAPRGRETHRRHQRLQGAAATLGSRAGDRLDRERSRPIHRRNGTGPSSAPFESFAVIASSTVVFQRGVATA